jgi:hypothetical protein
MPFLLYPYLLLVSSLIFIFLVPEKRAVPEPVEGLASESAPEEK